MALKPSNNSNFEQLALKDTEPFKPQQFGTADVEGVNVWLSVFSLLRLGYIVIDGGFVGVKSGTD